MASLKEEAQAYEPMQIKNIADLDVISIDTEIKEANDAEFPFKYVLVDGEQYKVPVSVIAAIKDLLKVNPNLKKFRVLKNGEGLKTRYTTVPIL